MFGSCMSLAPVLGVVSYEKAHIALDVYVSIYKI